MHFFKYQALGNDYIIIDNTDKKITDYENTSKRMCDRHFSVGADGMIFVERKENYFMNIYNADGSKALMCGNGIRCFARYLYLHGYEKQRDFIIDTPSGLKNVWIKNEGKFMVKVDMGSPEFEAKEVPVSYFENSVLGRPVIIGGVTYYLNCVSMGNPHTCIFVNDICETPLEKIGDFLECSSLFPEGTNIEIIQVIDKKNIKMRVWERGVGETFACGTGACAAQVISMLCGYTNEDVSVHMKFGKLNVNWDRECDKVLLSGEACFAYEGDINI